MSNAPVLLEMRSITKEFPGVKALSDVNLVVRAGEIHAICGENGAGKSTLMKVLSGVYPHGTYSGEITYQGQEVRFSDIRASERAGIVIIHQELALVPGMSITENIFLGSSCPSGRTSPWYCVPASARSMLAGTSFARRRLDLRFLLELDNLEVVPIRVCERPEAAGGAIRDGSEPVHAGRPELRLDGVEVVDVEVEDHSARLVVLRVDVVALLDDQQEAAEIDRPFALMSRCKRPAVPVTQFRRLGGAKKDAAGFRCYHSRSPCCMRMAVAFGRELASALL